MFVNDRGHPFIETEGWLLCFHRWVSRAVAAATMRRHRLVPIQALSERAGLLLMRPESAPSDPYELEAELLATGLVFGAGPDWLTSSDSQQRSSDQPVDKLQWHLGDDGVRARSAWDHTTGGRATVAMIDTGFMITHESLVQSVSPWSGHFDETYPGRWCGGYDPPADDAVRCEMEAHGTKSAGMIGARGPSIRGVRGLAPDAQLTLITLPEGYPLSQFIRALLYATDVRFEVANADSTGADVLALSNDPDLDTSSSSTNCLARAFSVATRFGRSGLGSPTFYALPNESDADTDDSWLANHTDVVSIGTLDSNGGRSGAHGRALDAVAPGSALWTTTSYAHDAPFDDRFSGPEHGNSYACPLAAGTAALVLSLRPSYSRVDLEELLLGTTRRIGADPYPPPGRNDRYGYGAIDATNAVQAALDDCK